MHFFDPVFIDDVNARMVERWHFDARVHDMLDGPVPGSFDAVYACDVLEHIEPERERQFLDNCFANLDTTLPCCADVGNVSA